MPQMIFRLIKIIACLAIASSLMQGCAHRQYTNNVLISLNPKIVKDKQEIDRVKEVVKGINERNQTLEDSQEWLKEAYSSLKIKKLNDIPKEEYSTYKKFLNKNTIYIIVHPAYYTFFDNHGMVLSSKKDREIFPSKNIVERLYSQPSFYDLKFKILQEQERLLRNFIELASTGKMLIILILPRDYKNHLTYGYIEGLDEYARYINEVTNMSESVIYVESITEGKGDITTPDMEILAEFLKDMGVETILLGGGYIGRCLEEFYISITGRFDNVYIVPEISAVSQQDINNKWGQALLTGDGRINFKAAARNLTSAGAYDMQSKLVPKVRRLLMYNFYPKQ